MFKSNLFTAILASALTAMVTYAGPVVAREVGARLAAPAATTQTTVPIQVRLQTSTGAPVNGLTSVGFCLYNVPTGGSCFFGEGGQVNVVDGLMTWLLGSVGALNKSYFDGTVYLGISVGGESEMQPRIQLGSAPVAMSVPAGSITGANIADLSVSPRKIAAKTYRADSGPYPGNPFTVTTSFDIITPLNLSVPAGDLPVDTLALVMISAECLHTGAANDLTFVTLVDGGVATLYNDYQYENAWQNNEWRKLHSQMVVPLAANMAHSVAAYAVTSAGNILCYNRHAAIVLLGGQ